MKLLNDGGINQNLCVPTDERQGDERDSGIYNGRNIEINVFKGLSFWLMIES